MVSQVKKFMNDENQIFTEQARMLRRAPGKAVRGAAAKSAKRIRALQEPVRVVTHSGVKLTNVSHEAVLSLMALQLDVVTSALSDAAAQLERVAQSDNVRDLVSGQAGELRAVRERVVSDVNRAVAIVRKAGRGVRSVATETYSKVARPAQAAKAKAKRNVKRAGRKTSVKAKAPAKKAVRRAR
jgi:phasin family protein